MKKKLVLMALALGLAGSFFRADSAQAQGLHELGYGESSRKMLLDGLKLSEPQKQALRQYRRNKSEIEKQGLKIKIERIDLITLLRDENSSEEATLAQLEKVNDALNAYNHMRVKNLLLLKSALSPEQIRELLERLGDLRRQKHPGPGGPRRFKEKNHEAVFPGDHQRRGSHSQERARMHGPGQLDCTGPECSRTGGLPPPEHAPGRELEDPAELNLVPDIDVPGL